MPPSSGTGPRAPQEHCGPNPRAERGEDRPGQLGETRVGKPVAMGRPASQALRDTTLPTRGPRCTFSPSPANPAEFHQQPN